MDSIHIDVMCKIMCINTKKSDNNIAEQRKPTKMCVELLQLVKVWENTKLTSQSVLQGNMVTEQFG